MPIENNIYSIEYLYNPAPTNNLLIYNKQNNTTQIIPLSLPSGINGSERKIISLARDENNIIGVLTENIFFNNSTNHLISIDLQDFSITELGITFNEGFITSMIKINSKLYLSTWADGFLEVDLLTNTVNNSSSIKGSRMARINDSELAIMQQVSGYINGGKPEKINLTYQTVTSNFNEEPYGLITVFGTSIYENQQYFNLVSSLTLGLQFGILKSNFETSENLFVEIGPMDMNRNLIILGIEN